ncbi:hypothetical protein JG688_00016638 [Phytophthora aleatoria]|uniref:Uncharacterized protein n=1 Tax=Phytophthora aleatoria TaxID=2496075 RepID=A0A8J5IDU5_9STRA|nr:hypothetical protein JG688_00016638 [Phytophthora aleatoria]
MTFRSSGQVRGGFRPRCLICGADLGGITEGPHRSSDFRFTALGKVLNIPEAEINLWEGIHLGKFAVTM